jgi:hypothetical protein
MDYSLQLAASVQNFIAAKSAGQPVKQIYGLRGANPGQE